MSKLLRPLEMGSQVSSVGQKTEPSTTQSSGDTESVYRTSVKEDEVPQKQPSPKHHHSHQEQPKQQQQQKQEQLLVQQQQQQQQQHNNEATNTNARERSQPDRLKLLFRDQRGYRALSEQKVSEWLNKYKQYYMVFPKDLTEIPEQIFSPLGQHEPDGLHDEPHSVHAKSEVSTHNLDSRGMVESSEVYPLQKHRDKMNHFSQKLSTPRHHINHSSMVVHKSELSQARVKRSLTRHPRERCRRHERQFHRGERSTTTTESVSTRLLHRDLERLSGLQKRNRATCPRRDSHSLLPNAPQLHRKQSEGWQVNPTCLGPRKTLPSTLQNNAYSQQHGRLTETCVEPVRCSQQSISFKRIQTPKRQTMVTLPINEKVPRKFERLPVGKDSRIQEARDQFTKSAKSRSHSVFWRSPCTIKQFQRFVTMWMGGNEKSNERFEVSDRLV